MNRYTTHLHQFVAEGGRTVFWPNIATLIEYRRRGCGMFKIMGSLGVQSLRQKVSVVARHRSGLGEGVPTCYELLRDTYCAQEQRDLGEQHEVCRCKFSSAI